MIKIRIDYSETTERDKAKTIKQSIKKVFGINADYRFNWKL